jgi:YjbE family integral membrane protein
VAAFFWTTDHCALSPLPSPGSGRTRACGQRYVIILVGIVAATALRILFAGITTQLLQIIGLLLAGGILLLWVCWKMWRELRNSPAKPQEDAEALVSYDINVDGTIAGRVHRKTFGQAALQIIVADVSMSLDNVLAVAGAAREHPMVLAFGLLQSTQAHRNKQRLEPGVQILIPRCPVMLLDNVTVRQLLPRLQAKRKLPLLPREQRPRRTMASTCSRAIVCSVRLVLDKLRLIEDAYPMRSSAILGGACHRSGDRV